MYPALSVIIPVYNREKLVVRTLDSVFAQSYRPLEVIVVDNASTDSTYEKLTEWKARHDNEDFRMVIANEPQPGAARARQTGFTLATSDVVIFFDSDDTMRPELAGKVMEQFHLHPDTDMVYWPTAYGSQSLDGRIHPRHFSTKNILRRHIFNGMLSTLSYATTADFFRRCGGWDTTLTGWDDWELGLRMLLGNPKMRPLKEPMVTIYPQPTSITGTDFTSKHGEWEKAIAAMGRSADKQPEPLRARLHRLLLYRKVNLAALYKSEGSDSYARTLLDATLQSANLTLWRKCLLKLIYAYTSRGGRCAYLLWH